MEGTNVRRSVRAPAALVLAILVAGVMVPPAAASAGQTGQGKASNLSDPYSDPYGDPYADPYSDVYSGGSTTVAPGTEGNIEQGIESSTNSDGGGLPFTGGGVLLFMLIGVGLIVVGILGLIRRRNAY